MRVRSVAADRRHRFSKQPAESITLIAGEGVAGDAHRGVTVQHLSRLRSTPGAPNLRQVHLVQGELIDELVTRGFGVAPGVIGENVLTDGIDLLGLPTGTTLRLGADAVVEVTGLRNPCVQLERYEHGLMSAVLDRDEHGELIRRAGVMAVVRTGGEVHVGDAITVEMPPEPHRPLRPV